MQAVFSCRTHFGLGVFLALASFAGATCDPAFNSNAITTAISGHGYIAVSNGNDGVIRFSEDDELSGTSWGGWMNLSTTADPGGIYSQAGIQEYVQNVENYVYAIKGDSLIQWAVKHNASTFTRNRTAVYGIPSGFSTSTRPAAARLSSTIKTAVAVNANGTIMLRSNTSGTWGSWISLSGLSNAQGSPWMTQLPSYQVNLYVRTSDQKIRQNHWNGTSWSGWGDIVSSGVNSDPASTYDASTSTHYLYFLNTSDVTTKWTYTTYWSSATLPSFPGRKSFSAVMTNGGATLFGQDYQGNTYKGDNGWEVNCLTP